MIPSPLNTGPTSRGESLQHIALGVVLYIQTIAPCNGLHRYPSDRGGHLRGDLEKSKARLPGSEYIILDEAPDLNRGWRAFASCTQRIPKWAPVTSLVKPMLIGVISYQSESLTCQLLSSGQRGSVCLTGVFCFFFVVENFFQIDFQLKIFFPSLSLKNAKEMWLPFPVWIMLLFQTTILMRT